MSSPASTITDETVKRAADAWGLAILNGGGEATVLGVMRTALEAVWPELPFTQEELLLLRQALDYTDIYYGIAESDLTVIHSKLEALANGS